MLKFKKEKPKFMYFDTDDDFYKFAVDPVLDIKKDVTECNGQKIHSYDFKFTEAYTDAVNKGIQFVINDKESKINKRGTISVYLITRPIDNLYVNY